MTRPAAHVRNLTGPLVRAVYRPRVIGVDTLPRRGGVLLVIVGDANIRMPINGLLPRPVVEVADGPWPTWATVAGDAVGWLALGDQRRARLRQAGNLLTDGAVGYRVHAAGDWDWVAYLHMHSAAPVQPLAVLGGRRPALHLAAPREHATPHDRAGLRRSAEAIRQHATDHLVSARARAGR